MSPATVTKSGDVGEEGVPGSATLRKFSMYLVALPDLRLMDDVMLTLSDAASVNMKTESPGVVDASMQA